MSQQVPGQTLRRAFVVKPDNTVEARGVLGFFDNDNQKDLMLKYSEEEKVAEEKEETVPGFRKLPQFAFSIEATDSRQEVNAVTRLNMSDVENDSGILLRIVEDFGIFANNARRRFGHFFLESADSKIVDSKEERVFYSTLMCSRPPGVSGQQGWYDIDLMDVVSKCSHYNNFSIVKVNGADTMEELREHIVAALGNQFKKEDSLCLRYVFPEQAQTREYPLSVLRGIGTHNDVLTRANNIFGPTGVYPGERTPAFTASMIVFSNN